MRGRAAVVSLCDRLRSIQRRRRAYQLRSPHIRPHVHEPVYIVARLAGLRDLVVASFPGAVHHLTRHAIQERAAFASCVPLGHLRYLCRARRNLYRYELLGKIAAR